MKFHHISHQFMLLVNLKKQKLFTIIVKRLLELQQNHSNNHQNSHSNNNSNSSSHKNFLMFLLLNKKVWWIYLLLRLKKRGKMLERFFF